MRPWSKISSGQDKDVKPGEANYHNHKAKGHLPLARVFCLIGQFSHSLSSRGDQFVVLILSKICSKGQKLRESVELRT